jgi:hypothetical protein
MILPDTLSVRVVKDSPSGAPVQNVLVWFRTFISGTPYFEGIVDLTDDAGVAEISSNELRQQFEENQRAFPTDYKVPLEDCDDDIEVGIDGRDEFRAAKANVSDHEFISSRVRDLYSRAQNERFVSATSRRPLLLVKSSASAVDLLVREHRD